MTSRTHPANSSETPDLRIVPIELLVEHEYNDAQRTTPLAKRLEAEGLLKNPPIVAPLDDDPRFVVLDGANRTTACTRWVTNSAWCRRSNMKTRRSPSAPGTTSSPASRSKTMSRRHSRH